MPKSLLRRFTKKTLLFVTIGICFVFLLSVLIPIVHPQKVWMFGFLGLTVPYVSIILFFIAVFWLIAKPVLSLIPLLSLLVGYKQLSVLASFHFSKQTTEKETHESLRIVSWNVANMYGLSRDPNVRKHNRLEIARSVLDQKADIICLQEFNHSFTEGPFADNISLFKEQYPFHYYAINFNKYNGYYTSGTILFSKIPILDTGTISFKAQGNIQDKLLYADIKFSSDTLRIYTTHLHSFSFTTEDYADLEKIKKHDSEAVEASKNIFKKMQMAFSNRAMQADIVAASTHHSPYPYILCGDFNDVPNSYTYFKTKGHLQDAFLAAGYGIGKTYMRLAPFLRIDYVMADTSLVVDQFTLIDEKLSDHALLSTDIRWKK
jgi:endonuclease/exonuclease/phosphatase family metal-dependent hydrolase